MTVKFTFSGGKELEAALRELGNQVAGRLGNNATKAGARIIAAAARQKVPVRTGALKRSITVVGDDELRRAGGSVRQAFVVARAPHAALVELGTAPRRQKNGRFTGSGRAHPYLRPALDEAGQAAIDRMASNLWSGIEREAERLGKGLITPQFNSFGGEE
jgi:HK97 gp10 family phage protein